MDSTRLLRLLQLVDSGFPTGAFAFSQGLEGLAAAGLVRNEADVAALVRTQIEEGFRGIEAPVTMQAHRLAEAGEMSALLALDGMVTALKPVPAFRSASMRTGRRFMEAAAALVGGPMVMACRDAVTARHAAGHHAIAFGIVMEAAGMDGETTATALGATFAGGLVTAAVRLGLIGQTAAQRIVLDQQPALLAAVDAAATMRLDEMGAYTPLIDVAGLRQPVLPGRLFGS